MQLEGLHHVTAITGDAARNLDFYVRVMGLRLVKKTVNQDDPTVYHLFYGDDDGSPGHDLTFFEYPHAALGRAGDGMVHTIALRVASTATLDFWSDRLTAEGVTVERDGDELRFSDPEGLGFALIAEDVPDAPLVAHSDVPAEHALRGFAGVRAFSSAPTDSATTLEEVLGFVPDGQSIGRWEVRGSERGGWIAYDPPPAERGRQSAGTVHHVAWATRLDEQDSWQERVTGAGVQATPVIDRFYFRSIYFREPSGVLFELATMGPGFGVDEDPGHLGEGLALPPFLESRREQIERALTPLPDPRTLTSRRRGPGDKHAIGPGAGF
ncbi:MAG: VOC family protein [Solirubrobacterales bacterium]|nr:VOC family protein [Solirubrobacterales bacterium]